MKEGSQVIIREGAVKIMETECEMAHIEKGRMGCIGRKWEEEG